MKVVSLDSGSRITVERHEDPGGYASFAVEAQVDIGHGQFRAWNADVHFLNLEAFAAELDRFVLDRSLAPRLEGTYDTFLALSASGNAVFLAFQVGDAFCGRKTVDFRLSGAFEIDPGTLTALAEEFRVCPKARNSR
ncbi:MAG: hypothetical protein KA419_03200 [Acidobacteria bacterium]|nr:hypothetical protein [Acidobacteriota bacterium]